MTLDLAGAFGLGFFNLETFPPPLVLILLPLLDLCIELLPKELRLVLELGGEGENDCDVIEGIVVWENTNVLPCVDFDCCILCSSGVMSGGVGMLTVDPADGGSESVP